MNGDLKRDLETAVLSPMSLEQVAAMLRHYKAIGVTRDEVYTFLNSMRKKIHDEALEDRILEISDFVAGFCSSHMKIWDQ